MNKIEIVPEIINLNINEINIIINFDNINNIDDFILSIYKGLGCPDDFGLNLNAFFDTIKDKNFWVTRPLNIYLKNFNNYTKLNKPSGNILKEIFIEIIMIESGKYNIFILK